jgi:uncharacterized protein YqgV (UPF0045/DUF77 family)
MVAEVEIRAKDKNLPVNHDSDESLKIIKKSGLPYRLTPSGACIEGEWDEVMDVIRTCHYRMRTRSSHTVMLVKIEDTDEKGNRSGVRHVSAA